MTRRRNFGQEKKREKKLVVKKVVSPLPTKAAFSEESLKARKALASVYDKVLLVDNIESARSIVKLLTTKYKSFIHACHTQVKRNPAWLLDLFAPMEWSGCPSLFIKAKPFVSQRHKMFHFL